MFVDTHAHLLGITTGGTDYDGAGAASLGEDDQASAKIEILMPPPFAYSWPDTYEYTAFQATVAKHRGRMVFAGGGGTLNPTIQEAVKAGSTSSALRSRFETYARQILSAGAVAFGETTALHLSYSPNHAYIVAPPDHQLFLDLADIAAGAGVPIDLHMYPVPQNNMPTPPPMRQVSPLNPATLTENVAGFERLLGHNPAAIIVWDHAGGGFTGCNTAGLAGNLLGKHPNLYLQVRPDVYGADPAQTLITSSGQIDANWLAVIKAYPDRIVIGGDNFWPAPNAKTPFTLVTKNLGGSRSFVDKLPSDIACKVASDNALRIYKLG